MSDSNLTADEIALYDRQIRLWGMAAQARMRSAKVLLINLGSMGTEITKNVVLSGIGSFTVLDNSIVTESDLGSQFFLAKEDVGKRKLDAVEHRVKDLNPRVELNLIQKSFTEQPEKFYSDFDLIIATEIDKDSSIILNKITRKFNIPLYICNSNGLFAYIFVDLIKFDSEDEKLRSAQKTTLGSISDNREIINVFEKHDENDEKKICEVITTRHHYKSFESLLKTATLSGKLNKRQMKRLSPVVPLTFASFHTKDMSINSLTASAEIISQKMGIPTTTVTPTYVEQFVQQSGAEFAPVSAIIGGAVAQDVINILGKRQSPINNMIIFDGITLDMPIYEL